LPVGVGCQRRDATVNNIPRVPRPPILMVPKREKGTLKVAMLGVTLRVTMTSAGFQGMSLDVILSSSVSTEDEEVGVWCEFERDGLAEEESLELKYLRGICDDGPGAMTQTLGVALREAGLKLSIDGVGVGVGVSVGVDWLDARYWTMVHVSE
jgi:hypothetical protein